MEKYKDKVVLTIEEYELLKITLQNISKQLNNGQRNNGIKPESQRKIC